MTPSAVLSPELIRARLQQLEAEKVALSALLRVYDHTYRPTAAAQPSPQIRLNLNKPSTVPNSSSNGTTLAILNAVKNQPGIHKSELVDEVLANINPTAKNPKDNVKTIIRYQVRQGKIEQRGDQFFPAT